MDQIKREIKKMIEAEMSKIEIGRQLGMSRHQVRKIALEMGYSRWKHHKAQDPARLERRARVHELAMTGASLGEIARKLSVSRQCVHYHLKHIGVLDTWKALRKKQRER